MNEPVAMLEPVSVDDPCGPDLRWEPEVLQLQTSLSMLLADDDPAVVGARTASGPVTADDVMRTTSGLLRRTKSIFIMGVQAQARWVRDGLGGYAEAMEQLVLSVEAWPGPHDGIHPRADLEDGDLGERASAFARVVADAPHIAATIGWGRLEDPILRGHAAAALSDLFTQWSSRLAGALGDEPPPDAQAAWRAIRTIRGFEQSLAESGATDPGATVDSDAPSAHSPPSASRDAWQLLAIAAERMQEQSPHSPAVPMLQLVLRWQGMDLAQISETSRNANGQMGIDQMMDWAKKQLVGSG